MIGRPSLQHRVRHDDDSDFRGGKRSRRILGAVWHATDGVKWDGDWGTRWYLSKANTKDPKHASYTYVIDRDGTIIRHTPTDVIAYHAGVKCHSAPKEWITDRSRGSVNGTTLGICFVALLARDVQLTPEQLESGLWLGTVCMTNHNYGPDMNRAHREIAPTWKSDPLAEQLDMDHWRELLAAREWPSEITAFPIEEAICRG